MIETRTGGGRLGSNHKLQFINHKYCGRIGALLWRRLVVL
jgi:hypothetical protein